MISTNGENKLDFNAWLDLFGGARAEWLKSSVRHTDLFFGFDIQNEILSDGTSSGPNGEIWANHKLGTHQTLTFLNKREQYQQGFVKVDDTWQIDPKWKPLQG